MKKQLLLALALITAFISARSQAPDTARLLLHYKFTHVQDTTNRAHPYTENTVLYIGKSATAYRSYDRIQANEQFKKQFAAAKAASPDGNVRINRMGRGSSIEYYQYPNEQKLVTKSQVMINNYAIDEPLPAMQWKITGDTATFGSFHCQEATTHFKGRDYIAWFCPDLPVHAGPWKLNGLPGVIVDAHDAKNEVVFAFDGIENTMPTPPGTQLAGDDKDTPPILRGLNDDMNLIAPPPDAIKTTQKDYDKIQEAFKKDPNAVVQGMMASQRGDMAGPGGSGPKMDVMKVRVGHEPIINNPIELPEKQ